MTKKSFLLHIDSLCILDKMTDEQAGIFLKAIYHYQLHIELPKLDFSIEMAITPFINQFKRDNEKYIGISEKRKELGSLGGKQKVANATKSKQSVANVADSDSDSDSVKEINKSILVDKFENLSIFISKFNLARKSNFKHTSEKLANALNARLKEKYTIEQIISATRNAMREKYHIENKYRHLTPEFMLRQDKLEKYLDQVSAPEEQHLGFYKGKPILESNGRKFIHIGEGVEYIYPPKPNTTGWTEEEKYNYFTCDRYDGYWSDLYKKAMDSQMNTTEKEKRGIYKWFYNQETLRFKEANHRNVRTS